MSTPVELLWLAVLMYAAASFTSWWALFGRREPGLPTHVAALLWLGGGMHALHLSARALELGVPPVTSGLEGLSLLALLAVLLFLGFVRRYPIGALGALVAPMAALNLAASLVFGPPAGDVPAALKTGYFWVHISLAFLGNALLALAAAAGLAYVVQDRNMRLRKLEEARRLPTLNVADAVAYRTATLGFLFMTLGIVSGMAYSRHAWQSWWSWDPRQTWSLVTWFCYAGLLHVRLLSGWRGRRWAWLTVGAFAMVVGASVVLDVFKVGKHSGNFDGRARAGTSPADGYGTERPGGG